MAVKPADLPLLSRLLDLALDLSDDHIEPWLASLPPEHAHLAPRLLEMLASRRSTVGGAFLAGRPRLTAADESVANADDRVGPYRLLREIGRGGMGTVWLAERADGSYQRQVALKLPRLAWGAGLTERMARERDIGTRLEHPAIARLYDAGVDERGRPFLAFEYIDGQPIDAWCEAQALDVRRRLRLFVQVARAVAYAHGRLVVHRDLKPSNVMVMPDGQARLLDFGIAKLLTEAAPGQAGLTQEQGRVLTPHYASPEQIAGEAITVQSDVYSLGVLLYELLTGELPHAARRSTVGAVEDAILSGDVATASGRVRDKAFARALRGEVDAILAKAMQLNPSRRYATADALADDIERHLKGETVLARPYSLGYRLRKGLVRNRVAVSVCAAVLTAVIGGTSISVAQAQRAAKAAERQKLAIEFVSDVFRINYRANSNRTTTNELSGDRLLAEGAILIAQRFPGEPAMQAELYGVVSELFLEMGAGDQAVDYATRQGEALSISRADDKVRAIAMIRLARALLLKGRNADAENRARRALEMASGNDALRADALAVLAESLVYLGKLSECENTLDRLDESVRRLGRESVAEAWSYALRGFVLSVQDRFPETGELWARGINLALRVEGPLSLAAISMQATRSRQLIMHGQSAEGKAMADAAVQSLRLRGGASAIAAEALAAFLARTLYSFEIISYREAMDVIDRSSAFVANQPAVPQAIRKAMDFERGVVMGGWGDVASAWKAVSESADAALSASDSPFINFYIAGAAQSIALAAGDFEGARRWNQEVVRLRDAKGESGHPFALQDFANAAMIESEQGNSERALSILDAAPRISSVAEPKVAVLLANSLLWTRARVLIDSGQAAAASKVVSELDANNESQRALVAELHCRAGEAMSSLRIFMSLIESKATTQFEHSPSLAWLRAKAGLCALTAGDQPKAGVLAERARAAFNAQPGVSPYYKAPLIKLETALGIKTAAAR